MGELNRQVFRRLWELLAPEPLRANSCLIVMGSEGRGEQIVKTDQDNALMLRDGFVFEGLEAVTEAFTAALIEFGYPPCPGGIMLSRPPWRQPLAGFREPLRQWIHGADPEGPMNLAIFLDAAAVAGDAALLEQARDHVDRLLSDSDAFYARFAGAVDQFGGDGGWWSRLPGLRGRAAAEIDLKKLGIFPIVHGVRALALQYRVRALGTADRLRALVAEGRIDAALARDLIEALHFLIGLKLASNLRQMADGRAPDNGVRLAELGTLERQALKEALAIVRRFKQWLGRHYRLERVRQPVSTHGGCGVLCRVVGGAILPSAPENAAPRAPEDADRMRMPASSGARAGVDGGGPGRGVPGVVGEAGEGSAQAAVAGPAEADAAGLAGLVGDGAEAGIGGELVAVR